MDKWGNSVEERGIAGEKLAGIVEKPKRSDFFKIPVEKQPESVENPGLTGDERAWFVDKTAYKPGEA